MDKSGILLLLGVVIAFPCATLLLIDLMGIISVAVGHLGGFLELPMWGLGVCVIGLIAGFLMWLKGLKG